MMPKSTNDFNVNKVWIWLDVYSWLRALIDDDKQTNKTEGIIHYTAHANANTLALVNKSEEFFFFFSFQKDFKGTWRFWQHYVKGMNVKIWGAQRGEMRRCLHPDTRIHTCRALKRARRALFCVWTNEDEQPGHLLFSGCLTLHILTSDPQRQWY